MIDPESLQGTLRLNEVTIKPFNTRNTSACNLVIHSIARFPQAGDSQWLIANQVLVNLLSGSNGVNMIDLANIQPNPTSAAKKINYIHGLFGIEYTVSEEQAQGYVLAFAASALDVIRATTVDISTQLDLPIPTNLRIQISKDSQEQMMIDPTHINQERAYLLSQTLCSHSQLLQQVADRVQAQTRDVKQRAPNQRQEKRHN